MLGVMRDLHKQGRAERSSGQKSADFLQHGAVFQDAAVSEILRGLADARADGLRLELRHQDTFARLEAVLHRGARALAQAEHLGKQPGVFMRRGQRRAR